MAVPLSSLLVPALPLGTVEGLNLPTLAPPPPLTLRPLLRHQQALEVAGLVVPVWMCLSEGGWRRRRSSGGRSYGGYTLADQEKRDHDGTPLRETWVEQVEPGWRRWAERTELGGMGPVALGGAGD